MTKKDLSQNIYTLTFLNVHEQIKHMTYRQRKYHSTFKNEKLCRRSRVGGTRGHYAK